MKCFINDESGAITIEWVVFGAALFMVAIAMSAFIMGGFGGAAHRVDDGISHTDMPDEMRSLLTAAHGS